MAEGKEKKALSQVKQRKQSLAVRRLDSSVRWNDSFALPYSFGEGLMKISSEASAVQSGISRLIITPAASTSILPHLFFCNASQGNAGQDARHHKPA